MYSKRKVYVPKRLKKKVYGGELYGNSLVSRSPNNWTPGADYVVSGGKISRRQGTYLRMLKVTPAVRGDY